MMVTFLIRFRCRDDNDGRDNATDDDANADTDADSSISFSSLDESESSLALSCRPSISTGLVQFELKARSTHIFLLSPVAYRCTYQDYVL